jgi:hypothetical protein
MINVPQRADLSRDAHFQVTRAECSQIAAFLIYTVSLCRGLDLMRYGPDTKL